MQPPQKLARSSCSPATCLSRKTTRKGIQLCRLRRLHGQHPDIRGHDSKVWNNPNHRIWPISQCSYLPGEVWGWNAFCFRFQQIQWTDDSVSWYFTPPQFTFFWWAGERMINIQWSRIMTKYELMIGKDLYWLQYIINIDKSWYKSWGGMLMEFINHENSLCQCRTVRCATSSTEWATLLARRHTGHVTGV